MAWTFGVCPCQCKNYSIRRKKGNCCMWVGETGRENRILFILNRPESDVAQSL